ncbi:hypothetical protein GBAR_LOCUS30313, partial [Geodia barretti]
MNSLGGRWYRFRLFVARNTIPMVWIWAGTMLCGLGTVYYRLRKGEDITISLQDVRMHPNPDTLHTIHGWIKKLGLDQVSLTAYPPNLLIFPLHPQDYRQPKEKIAKQLQTHYMYPRIDTQMIDP